MDFALAMLCFLIAFALVIIGIVVLVFLGLRRIWRRTRSDQLVLRGLIVVLGVGFVVAPYMAFKFEERRWILAHVPQPLDVAEIEFRVEELYGTGFMPGDNETGFVVYRLTDASALWARDQGRRLGEALEGTEGTWLVTPVDDRSTEQAVSQWHPYDNPPVRGAERIARDPPNVSEFLGKYGFEISIDARFEREANEAIQSGGSLYHYGPGGSVTIVDPNKGKVYFFYAG